MWETFDFKVAISQYSGLVIWEWSSDMGVV